MLPPTGGQPQTQSAPLKRALLRLSHLTTLAVLALFTRRLIANLRYLRALRQRASEPLPCQPFVSVLVPARNEAENITPCVTSLLEQSYPNYELIVLNDGSTDSTSAQLDALAAHNPRLRVIHAHDTLPPGWNGKSYACHRLAQQARGEWLLFTDADTQHTSQSIAHGLAQTLALDADLVSAFPTQITHSWGERVVVSFVLDFLPLIGLNFRAISQGHGTHSAGNGQYLLARATTYRQVGGHAAIGHATLDDFALAKHYRLQGHRIALIGGQTLLRCRMYRNVREVWEGFSRSLMHGLDNSTLTPHSLLWALLFGWGYGSTFVTPLYVGFLGAYGKLALIEVLWLALLRGVATWHLRRSPLEILTTPLAALSVMAVALAALYRRWQGQRVNWKGRYYMG
jgi:chlorobactene glucosyltransferase